MTYVIWIVALFFSISWSLGLFVQPNLRLKSTIVTLVYWWLIIGIVFLLEFSVYHLIWLMPLALFVPLIFMQTKVLSQRYTSTVSIFIKSLFILGTAIWLLYYFS